MTRRVDLAPGYSICRLINGGWQLSEGHLEGGYDRLAALDDLRRLVETGLTTFDCADIYVGVEELLGDLGRSLVDDSQLQIHTKFVPDRSSLASLTRRDVEESVDRSLRRLGVERLDLVQFHWWDYQVPGYLEAAGWLAEQQVAGKIRLLGTTNFDTAHLREMGEAGISIASNQVQYSLLDRRPESEMVDFCRQQGIQLLCYGVVGGGFLSSRWVGMPDPQTAVANRSLTKYRLIIEEFGGWPLFQEVLGVLSQIARRHGVSLANVATRWVLDRPQVAAVMIGARSARHLRDNLRVFDLHLQPEDQETLDDFLARSRGPEGEPFDLERQPDGRHASIMKTDLNRQ